MNYNNLYGKTAVFCGADLPFEIRSYPVSAPHKGYALLRLIGTGICGTDVHIHHGRLQQSNPLIIGHEFIGEVIDINESDTDVKIGDRVIFNMASPCGKCKLCLSGDSANCEAFEVAYIRNPEEEPHFFGGYGEYVYAKAKRSDGALILIPDNVDVLAAAMFPCAGPTITHALKLGGLFKNNAENIETAVIIGAGPLGLFSSLWLSHAGVPNIYTVKRTKDSLRSRQVESLTKSKVLTVDEVSELNKNGMKADLIIECSGNPESFNIGCELLRNRGIFLVPGQYSDSGNISFGPQIITFKALRVIGSSQYDASDVSDYINFLSNNPEILPRIAACVKTFALDKVNEAHEAAEKFLYSKIILK